jgi:D-alanyl-D-alanine carboxypeptidase
LNDKVFGTGGILQSEFPETSTYPYVNGVTSVTVKNLLQHNSGWTDQLIFDTSEPISSMTLDQRIDYLVHHVSMSSAVGSTYHYFNMGFCILGRIVEKLTGKTFETYLREVTAKAGVTDMWVDKSTRAEKRSNEVVFYSQASGGNAYLNPMEVVSSCGAIIASAPELMQLLCAEDYGTVVPDILKSSTLDLMYTPSPNYSHYGLGWRLNHSYFTNWASYHGGNLAGTGTLWVRGKKGVNAVVLCNSRSYREDIDFDTSLYDLLGTVMSAFGD